MPSLSSWHFFRYLEWKEVASITMKRKAMNSPEIHKETNGSRKKQDGKNAKTLILKLSMS